MPEIVRDTFEALEATPSAEFADALLARLRSEHSTARPDPIDDRAFDPLEPWPIEIVPLERRRRGRGERDGRRHRRRIAAVAACIAIAAAVFVTVGGGDPGEVISPGEPDPLTTTTAPPSVERLGFLGLPPEGAIANTAEAAERVASWYAAPHIGFPGGRGPLGEGGWYGASSLFSDGSLVTQRFDGPVTHAPDPSKDTGWYVQHLTPEGVELVRREIVSTGLFTASTPATQGTFGVIDVRVGDRIVDVSVNAFETPKAVDLLRHLGHVQSWLPRRGWESRAPMPWVPSRYTACLMGLGEHSPRALADPLGVVALLPVRAQALLSSATPRTGNGVVSCFEMTTSDARALAAAMEAGGLGPVRDSLSVTYTFDGEEVAPEASAVDLVLAPLQPDSTSGACC